MTVTSPRRDRRQERHESTRQEILAAAWEAVRAEGLASLSLRGLARTVGMEPQSLYTYFPSKNAIYDAMFAQGNEALLEARQRHSLHEDPFEALHDLARGYAEFCTSDPVRYQLLFQRTVPGFEPSAESYALARDVFGMLRADLAAAGVTSDADVDLYTALTTGVIDQQLSNDPGGDRWLRQIDRVVDMYLHEVGVTSRRRARPAARGKTKTPKTASPAKTP